MSASLTPDTFAPSDEINEARELQRAWDVISDETPADVVVRFSPAVAKRAAETRWHPSQEIEEQGDGSLLWRGRVAGLREIRIWILGWGADVEVLEPARAARDGHHRVEPSRRALFNWSLNCPTLARGHARDPSGMACGDSSERAEGSDRKFSYQST